MGINKNVNEMNKVTSGSIGLQTLINGNQADADNWKKASVLIEQQKNQELARLFKDNQDQIADLSKQYNAL